MAIVIAWSTTADAPAADIEGARIAVHTHELLEGESPEGRTCLTCGEVIGVDGLTLRHKGRRVYLCSTSCRAAWNGDMATYFAQIQARGALFDENSVVEKNMRTGWL